MAKRDRVVIIVSDNNYVEHTKSLIMNCRIQGNYDGDFAIVCPVASSAAHTFTDLGFYVVERDGENFFLKFQMFDEYFRKWRKAIYMDCDVIVQDDLNRLFDLLDTHDLWMDTEDCSTLQSFHKDKERHLHEEVYTHMIKNYPHVNNQTFNTGVVVFYPHSIPDNAPKTLMDIQREIEPANRLENGGTDQQVINLLLGNKCKKIEKKMVCFWGLAEPQNDVDSEYRKYKKGDKPVIVHYSRWYSPWIEKTPDADAYMCRRLNRPCNDIYKENLRLFNETYHKVEREKTLESLCDFYGTDKIDIGYLPYYKKHLPEKVNKFLEIGTWKGGGIRTFKDYYNGAGEFHALNISFGGEIISIPSLHLLGIKPHEGNQSDVNYLWSIKDKFGVIIDDGSHHSDEQIISFKHLFLNNMEEGGVYVIEDVFGHKNEFWRRGKVNTPEDTIMGVMRKYLNGGTLTSQLISESESNQLMSIIDEVNIYDDQIIFCTKKK